ncbi:ImmA/IrrE family metallo-endopeptidase [Paenarthrobacter ureafaciens]|jgi:Zn-dependent peptidase ImmA (M78 family)|uniref:ImmA/IrrE family metallo-endopeptidase n=1 Tax=Paenarthrobacter ureafaciens TaxID=37931 RepID=UPI00241EF8F2|nr:ImmA/IrrE family metallo-endopeptidase [Paenarthrobacter ureafaciens]
MKMYPQFLELQRSWTSKLRGDAGNLEVQAREVASDFRATYHLGTQPLGDLVALIEQTTGIDVAVLDVEPDEHGLTMRDPDRDTVFIAVARTPNPMRQRSTLAHELAHVCFEDWANGAVPAGRTPQEIRADNFARHLLLPVDGLREFLGPPRGAAGPEMLSQIVQHFLVSPRVAAIVLRDAGYIDAPTEESWRLFTTLGLAARYGWADQYHALRAQSEQRRAPQRLLARTINGYLANVVSTQTIATLRGMTAPEVEAELHAAGVVPDEPAIAWADAAGLPEVNVDLSDLDDPTDLLDSGGDSRPEGSAS